MKNNKDYSENRKLKSQTLAQQLKRESLLVRKSSIEVLKEFKLLEK